MQKIIIANWKMQLSHPDSLKLAREYIKNIKKNRNELAVCPDYSALPAVSSILKGSQLKLGAQDCASAAIGAYTGEVSPANLKKLGVRYVILGHSERRTHLHENSALINLKIKAALAQKLVPVLCIGEKLIEKNNGETEAYLAAELKQALKGVKIFGAADLIIAYEPVWAISTNGQAKALAASEADRLHAFIKAKAKCLLGQDVRVIYGGSVNSGNAAEFLAQKNIAGLLVGSASLKIKEFIAIIC